MISTSIQDTLDFQEYKDSLPKEPTDSNSKKEYIVGCYTPDDWIYIHEVLMQDGTLEDNIPSDRIECVNDYKHSPLRGRYLLTDDEVEQLRNHDRVEYVNINTAKYPGTYEIDPTQLQEFDKEFRYDSTVKCVRDNAGYGFSNYGLITSGTPDSTLKNRSSWQIRRHMQQADPWNGNDNALIEDRLQQYGTGKDVDLIMCDQDMWFGHIEFQNNLGGPSNYIGGNVLPGNGTCDLLDLVLDGPYYLDKDFFDANPSKKETRWDGTIVPTEAAAHAWWENNSTDHRSAKYVSPSNGGTATGNNDFGTISINSGYLRARCNGSNTAYQTGSGYHGTPCASQAYGRQYGWAYNANKWFINLYGSYNNGIESGFDMIKIFHQIKPINVLRGDKNPTITSNSWGYRLTPYSSGYYYYRQAGDGTGGISYSVTNWSAGTQPEFMTNMSQTSIRQEFASQGMLTAGNEMIDAGVIFICSAGNTNQKLVKADHPDYNNYYSITDNTSLLGTFQQGSYPYYRTINRQGFPGQIGASGSGSEKVYKTIVVGALDDDNRTSGTGDEQKVSYSNKGNIVDCYAAADYTLSACDDNWSNVSTEYKRNDAYYTINSQQSVESRDAQFNGTSSACPIACGLIATKLEYNRTWTYADIRNWLVNDVGTMPSDNFYYGTEETSATSTGWSDQNAVHDDAPIVIWDALTGNEPTPKKATIRLEQQLASGQDLVLELDGRNHSSNTTSWYNSAKNTHHVTLTSGVTYDGYGYVFSDSNYGSFARTSDFQTIGEFTFEAWFYMTGTPDATYPSALLSSWSTINNSNNKFIFYVNSSNTLVYELDNSAAYGGVTGTLSTTVSLNTWHHVVVTRSGNQISCYLDNVKDETTQIYSPNISASLADVLVGTYAGGISQSFEGTIGALRFYRRAFTDAEVETNYTQQQSTFGLVEKPKLSLEGITFTF